MNGRKVCRAHRVSGSSFLLKGQMLEQVFSSNFAEVTSTMTLARVKSEVTPRIDEDSNLKRK